MAKGSRSRHRSASRENRPTPYPLRSCSQEVSKKDVNQDTKCSKHPDKEDYMNAICPICMEYPHDAVLLLCSSHDKGCRPYICATSSIFSNCLDQYKKACPRMTDLSCPLCRGHVTGWTVVEYARKRLNAKKRSCMQDDCSFVGAYKDLRKHMMAAHPHAEPREVDPTHEEEWRRMEDERERNDVITTIRATTPGAVVVGDYVMEGANNSFRDMLSFFFLMQDNEGSGNNGGGISLNARLRRIQQDNERSPAQEDGDGTAVVDARGNRNGRVLLGRSARRPAFLIARYFARERILKMVKGNKKFLAIDKAIGENGFRVVTLLRLSPLLPFSLGNYLYGLTSVKFIPYVLGSWLGMLPGTWAYVSAGAFGRAFIQEESDIGLHGGNDGSQLLTLGLGLLATALAGAYVTRLAKDAVKDIE